MLRVFTLPPREQLLVINFMPPGALNGFCLLRKTIPRGCPRGRPTGKQMISALLRRQTHSKCGRLLENQRGNISRISNQFRKIEFWLIPPNNPLI